jgi:hypothetical protein
MAIDDEATASVLEGLSEAGGAGGLETGEDADGLQEGGLALGIGAYEDVHAGDEVDGQCFKAPKMAEGEIGEHVEGCFTGEDSKFET